MTLARYILSQFFRTFIPTFVVMVLFLLMQFLWKYVDDLVGKGVEWYYIAELLALTIPSTVPLALPLSILLASLITYGNLGEYNELAAMKSSGISLMRSLRPLIILVILLAVGEFFFSNYITPVANLRGENLLENITRKKPALNIREGVFYGGIEGYNIKVGKKYGPDKRLLQDVLIYDHTNKQGNSKVIVAKTGEMYLTTDEMFLVLILNDGYTYEDLYPEKRAERQRHPFTKTSFSSSTIRFNLRDFQSGDLRRESHRDFNMLNISQLETAIDSIKTDFSDRRTTVQAGMLAKYKYTSTDPDSTNLAVMQPVILDNIQKNMRLRAIENGLRLARSHKGYMDQLTAEYEWRHKVVARYTLEQHKKFSMAFACLVLFFIGAPLGAIIRKGGIGLPVVVSVIIFIVFWVMSFSFEKLGRELVWSPFRAMWTANFILLPVGIFLTFKSNRDSALFSMEVYQRPWYWLKSRIRRK